MAAQFAAPSRQWAHACRGVRRAFIADGNRMSTPLRTPELDFVPLSC
jgi:hypothetical protein